MLDITKLWNKIYLFGPNPAEFSRSDRLFLWTAIGFVVVGGILKLLSFRDERESPRRFLQNRLFHCFMTMGITVLVWVGTRFENILWLSTHFTVLLIFLIWLVWLFFIGWYFFRQFPQQQKLWQEEAIKRKYLSR